ncbi:MAG: 3-oxoadipyl-CoA thiolase, partial [Cytophagaceae bacterium]
MNQAYIIDGIRTPIGNFGGTLATMRPDDLAAHIIRELLRRNPSADPAAVADVIIGCANQAGEDNRNVARMAALLAGLPHTVPGETVNRLCASGLS